MCTDFALRVALQYWWCCLVQNCGVGRLFKNWQNGCSCSIYCYAKEPLMELTKIKKDLEEMVQVHFWIFLQFTLSMIMGSLQCSLWGFYPVFSWTVPVGANTVQNCQHHVKSLKGAIRVFVIWLKIFVPLLERYLSLGLNLVSEWPREIWAAQRRWRRAPNDWTNIFNNWEN